MFSPPTPSVEQQARSMELCALIAQRIRHAPHHIISFSDYMELALYTPELGYYMTNHPIFGKEGDFITAPELSPFFAHCLARSCAQVLEKTGGNILEIGAGSGKLAGDLLNALPVLPLHYYIYEISPILRQRQQHYLQQTFPELYPRVQWLTTLPENFSGMIIANEVMDALPTDCFAIGADQILARGVTLKEQQFVWQNYPAPQELKQAVAHLQQNLPVRLFKGYHSEISLRVSGWLKDLANCLQAGVILLMDYGFERKTFYHPERNEGTLMCHYRQYAHADPFWYPGTQDITVHVDFTAVAEIGAAHGLELMGFTPQAHFLLACGLLDLVQEQGEITYATKQHIQWLTSPTEMGESFKVMGLAKQCDLPLIGFQDFLQFPYKRPG